MSNKFSNMFKANPKLNFDELAGDLRPVILSTAVFVSATFAFALPSHAFTMAIPDDFGNISTGEGNWAAGLGHHGGTSTGTFDISIARPAIGTTATGAYNINYLPVDGEGHGSTATFAINYSVNYVIIPSTSRNYWAWTLTAAPQVQPRCIANFSTCRQISAVLHIDLTGLVFNGTSWVEQTASDNKVDSGLECRPRSGGQALPAESCTPVPAPLPLFGLLPIFGCFQKIRKHSNAIMQIKGRS
jgi:hypothetical protein